MDFLCPENSSKMLQFVAVSIHTSDVENEDFLVLRVVLTRFVTHLQKKCDILCHSEKYSVGAGLLEFRWNVILYFVTLYFKKCDIKNVVFKRLNYLFFYFVTFVTHFFKSIHARLVRNALCISVKLYGNVFRNHFVKYFVFIFSIIFRAICVFI